MQQTSPPEIRALSILHSAMLMGQVLFAGISLFISYSRNFSMAALQVYSRELMILCIAVGGLSYIAANTLFRKRMEKINTDHKPLSEKFNDYRGACLIRWGLIEFASLLSIILYLLTGNYIILIVAVVLILLFFTTKPSLPKTASNLGVSEMELENMKKEGL